MQQRENENGQRWHADRLNIENTVIRASHDISTCQPATFVGSRDRLIDSYLATVAGLTSGQINALEERALTSARTATSTDERLRWVWLAIACRAQGTRRTSNMFVGYFPKVVHANVFPSAAEKAGPLSVRELNAACAVAAAKVGWGRA